MPHKEPAAQEKGHLYPAEQPQFNKGETGKGATIGGKVTAKQGTVMPVGNDKYANKLRKDWSAAERAKSRFGSF